MKVEPELVLPAKDIKQVELFNHQKDAYEKFKDKDSFALFFEMGCGKTITSLYLAWDKYKKGLIDSLLVIAPNGVHVQWFRDILHPAVNAGKVFDEPVWVQCVGGNEGQTRLYPFENDNYFKIVTVNIDTFSTKNKWESIVAWANTNKTMIILDEATVIKNPSSIRSQRLLYEFNNVLKRGRAILSSQKKFPYRAVLTGTPVTNGVQDVWAIIEFISPGFFHMNYKSFCDYFSMYTTMTVSTGYNVKNIPVLLTEKSWNLIKSAENFTEAMYLTGCSEDTYLTVKHQNKFVGPYKHAEQLKDMLEPISVFAKLVDCHDMPEQVYETRYTGLNTEQETAYKQMKRDLLASYDGYSMTAMNKLVAQVRLQQISSGFMIARKDFTLTDFDSYVNSPDTYDVLPDEVVWLGDKIPRLEALMQDINNLDRPLLVLTRYSAEAEKIYNLCIDAGYKTGLFTGWKVIGGIDDFKEGKLDILVANSSKIARGFNLQNAHTTLFYTNSFSMETRQQAEFRTFRIGQKHSCLYIDYVSSPSDEIINQALVMKKSLLDFIRDKDIKECM